MNAGLTIRVRREPGCAIVTVAGEIDIATVARLRQRLNALADSGRPVIADLDQVGFHGRLGTRRDRRRIPARHRAREQLPGGLRPPPDPPVVPPRWARAPDPVGGTLVEALQALESDRPAQRD